MAAQKPDYHLIGIYTRYSSKIHIHHRKNPR